MTERTLHGQDATVRIADLGPRTIVETHKHDEERVGIVTRGSVAMVIAGEQRILTEGDTYVVPPATAHGIRVLEQGAQVVEIAAPAAAPAAKRGGAADRREEKAP